MMAMPDILGKVPTVNQTFTERALRLTRRNALLVISLSLLLAIVLGATFAPFLAPYDPTAIDFASKLKPPSLHHLMGTNNLGQDVFSQVLFGARASLTVGVGVVAFAILIGVPIGLVAGYFGGWLDTVLMRFTDVFLAFPPLLLPIAITAALGTGLFNAMLALAISWFPWYVRIVRGGVVQVKGELFISAARVMGVSDLRIMLRHALPNSLTPIIVQGSTDFGYAILAAASLSFIGIGAQPPTPEWGLMVALSRDRFLEAWWTVAGPGFAIFITVLSVNLMGDGLRDLLDPKHRSNS
jgi:peptide/nickel transport system permease protein